jgi:hypothetical protein
MSFRHHTSPSCQPSKNPRYEAFAQARARGALLNDAYEGGGFVPHRGDPSRLAYRAEVAERIAELRTAQTPAEDDTPVALLGALSRIIKAWEGSEDPSVVREARLAIVDAARSRRELEPAQAIDRAKIRSDFSRFDEAQIRAADLVDA